MDVVSGVKKATGDDFIIACRFNAFDAHPNGFGTNKDDFTSYDLEEPVKLAKMLCDSGVKLLGISAGNPYYIYPQYIRPFDTPAIGVPDAQEHPLESTERLFDIVAGIKAVTGDIPVVGTGYSWLRQFIPNAGAANLTQGRCSFIGLGRSSFAYPDAPRDMLTGKMSPEKCCITCSLCTQIMRDHGRTGCPIKDKEVYMPLYKQSREEAVKRGNNK